MVAPRGATAAAAAAAVARQDRGGAGWGRPNIPLDLEKWCGTELWMAPIDQEMSENSLVKMW